MPAITTSFSPSDSNVTLEPPNSLSLTPGSLLRRFTSDHIIFAVAALTVFVVVRFVSCKFAPSYCLRLKPRGTTSDPPRDSVKRESFAHHYYGQAAGESLRSFQGSTEAARHTLPQPQQAASEKEAKAFWVPDPWRVGVLEMDRSRDDRSRGVSRTSVADSTSRLPLPPSASSAARSPSTSSSQTPGRRASWQKSPRSSPSRRHSGAGTDGQPVREKAAAIATAPGTGDAGYVATEVVGVAATGSSSSDFDYDLSMSTSFARRFSRPPPPLPLTPPTLSTAIFTFEDRRPSYPVSIPPELDSSGPFIHQPNPDYMAASASEDLAMTITAGPPTTASSASSSPRATSISSAHHSPSTPRRRSYNKTLPIGIPVAAGNRDPSAESSSSSFSPSSYPPASPRLPPPPPGLDGFGFRYGYGYYDGEEVVVPAGEEDEDEGFGKMAAGVVHGQRQQRGIEVQGEIISVLDESGAGWKRHTRVYGGGVCLACAAAGGGGGGGGGGFYGDKVRPEERR